MKPFLIKLFYIQENAMKLSNNRTIVNNYIFLQNNVVKYLF